MDLSIIIPVHNQLKITKRCIEQIKKNSITNPEIIIIDNASDENIAGDIDNNIEIIKNNVNIGVYDTFKQGFLEANGDILAYLHSDLLIWERGWDQRIIDEFMNMDDLGLLGFIGSFEQDWDGGRGLGTMSNFKGSAECGSPAETHGRRINNLQPAVVIDGCSMIFRRLALQECGWPEWPPHHFYDRMFSYLMIKNDWRVGVLGISCDHCSGYTANREEGWHKTAEEWAKTNNLECVNNNWDLTIYREAERQFLSLLHKNKKFNKLIVNDDWSLKYV